MNCNNLKSVPIFRILLKQDEQVINQFSNRQAKLAVLPTLLQALAIIQVQVLHSAR